MSTRRQFCWNAAAALALSPRTLVASAPTRLNVAEIDHDRILAGAARALARTPGVTGDATSQAFLDMTLDLGALAAAQQIAPDLRYEALARSLLKQWFGPSLARLEPSAPAPEAVTLTAGLAEVAVALPFLALAKEDLDPAKSWFAEFLRWLTTSRTALLARDSRDHNAASWLLQVAAFAQATGAEEIVSEARQRFKTSTIRAEIAATGLFTHDLPGSNPFRDSLLSLDALAGVCVLLSTRFDSLWDHELQDGPGMHAAVARHATFIANPVTWPYPADQSHFHELPCRRPALLFAARAYAQADYAALWRTLKPDPESPEILRAFPIRQPLLWQTQPRRTT